MRSQSYQCPNCAGKLISDDAPDMLRCEHCGRAYTPEEVESANLNNRRVAAFQQDAELHSMQMSGRANPDEGNSDSEGYFLENAPWRDKDDGHLRHAECETCGASLYVDEFQVSCNCPYCGNNLVIKGLVSGEMTPDLIAPFRITRQQAADSLLEHCQQGLLPTGFAKHVSLEHIVGMYVPFWLFDADVEGSATCVSSERNISFSAMLKIPSISYETTSFNYRLKSSFLGLPADASSRMPDGYMDAIEPFDLGDARPFKASYLVDHVAELRDVGAWECCKRATLRMLNSVWNNLARTFVERESRQWISEKADLQMSWKGLKCCYLPVWMLHARWRHRDVLLAVNGQTGKVVSRLPSGKVKQAALHVGSAALCIAVCAIAAIAIWALGFALLGLVADAITSGSGHSSNFSQGVVLFWVIPFLCAIGTGWVVKKGKKSHRKAVRKREAVLHTAHRGEHADDYQEDVELVCEGTDDQPTSSFNPIPGMKARLEIDKSFGVYCGKDSFGGMRPQEITSDFEDEWVSIVKVR